MKLIIDTNFLLIPGNFGVDIFAEFQKITDTKYTLAIFNNTINELKKIMETAKGKDKRSAKLALTLLNKNQPQFIQSTYDVDTDIIHYATKHKCYVATQDAELKRKLKQTKAILISLRQKSHLILNK